LGRCIGDEGEAVRIGFTPQACAAQPGELAEGSDESAGEVHERYALCM